MTRLSRKYPGMQCTGLVKLSTQATPGADAFLQEACILSLHQHLPFAYTEARHNTRTGYTRPVPHAPQSSKTSAFQIMSDSEDA